VRYHRGGTRLELGATWLGPWIGYDWQLIQRVEAGQAALRDRVREYWLDYPGVLRPFVGIGLDLGQRLRATARAEWSASGDALLRDNLTPGPAASLLVGLQFNPALRP
jgi:hypothetical protein